MYSKYPPLQRWRVHRIKRSLVNRIFFSYLPLTAIGLIAVGIIAMSILFAATPNVQYIREQDLSEPLVVYSKEKVLLSQFGTIRRHYLTYDEIPKNLVLAFLAAEDHEFFSHSGINLLSLMRAAAEWLQTGKIKSGGSTISMQLARNYFLTPKQTVTRKLQEIIIALKLEQSLSKEEILELYLNKIYLGNRAYGVDAAAEIYYNKPISELGLAEYATLASLPKAPSRINPWNSPKRALERRNYTLGHMLDLGYITQAQHDEAVAAPNRAIYTLKDNAAGSEYIAEMVRLKLLKNPKKYLDRDSIDTKALYSEGFQVYTTVNYSLQKRAYEAAIERLFREDLKGGYRGVKAHIKLRDDFFNQSPEMVTEEIKQKLRYYQLDSLSHYLQPAMVTHVDAKGLKIQDFHGSKINLTFKANPLAKRIQKTKGGPAFRVDPQKRFKVGDVVLTYTPEGAKAPRLTQLSELQTALVSLDASDGHILALVGGMDFSRSKFNRATQAKRQLGSAIKPFVYYAALKNGLTPASIVSDAPLIDSPAGPEKAVEGEKETPADANNIWRPSNATKDFLGDISLRKALSRSRNLATLQVARQIGLKEVTNTLRNLGAPESLLSKDMTLILGTGLITPLESAALYAQIANEGHRVQPYVIDRVLSRDGKVLYQHPLLRCSLPAEVQSSSNTTKQKPSSIAQGCPRSMLEAEHFLLRSMMESVIQGGTGRRALVLHRKDMGGKTGTTSSGLDTWFVGFVPGVVTSIWFGYDESNTKRPNSFGASVALPAWIDYMRAVLPLYPAQKKSMPSSVVKRYIHPDTFLLSDPSVDPDAVEEYFKRGTEPQEYYQDKQGRTGEVVEGVGVVVNPTDIF